MLATQFADQAADLADLDRVEADGGFIQDHHARIVHDRLSDAHPLLVAFGQIADQAFSGLGQAATLFGFVNGSGDFVPGNAVQSRGQVEIFIHGQFPVQGRGFRQVAEQRLGCTRVLKQVDAADLDGAVAGRQASGQHLQGGGLSGTIRAQQAQHLALAQFEADVSYGGAGAVVAGKIFGGNCNRRHALVALKKSKYVLIWGTRKERICQLHYYIPVMKFKYLLLAPAALVAAGCAQLSPKEAVQPVAVPERAARIPELPKVDLTEQMLFQYLVSEVAGQRGDTGLATEGMLDLAKTTRDPRLARRAAEIALQSRRENQALEAATLWHQIDPDEAQATQAVAALLLNGGRLQEAKPHLEKLLAGEGDNVGGALLHLNQMLSRQKDKPATLALVQGLVAPYLNRAEAHFAIAYAAWSADQSELALSEVREARRLRSNWEAAALFHGQLLQRTSIPETLEFYRSLLGEYPKMQDVRLAYARLLVGNRQYVEARAQFEKLLGDQPGNPDVSVAVGLLAMQLKDYDAAEKYLKQALAGKNRDEAMVRMYLGQLFDERGRYAEAAEWYGSVGQSEQYIPAQIRYAAMLVKQGKLPEARQHLRQVPVQNNQQRVQVIVAEAQMLREAKAYGEAFELLGKALEKLPNYPDLLYDHAMAAEKLGKIDILEQDLRKLIQIKPDYAHAYNALGYTLADRSERLDEARQLIEKALELSPDDFFIMDSLGWVYYRMGQLEKAEDTLKRAYTGQHDVEIAAHLGEVLWARGKHEEAEKTWRAALKENPGHETLLNVIKKFVPAVR